MSIEEWVEANRAEIVRGIMDRRASKTTREFAAMLEIERLRDAARTAISIIDANLYHQREKVEDAATILREALNQSP